MALKKNIRGNFDIELSPDQVELLVSALSVVSPVGGGSSPHSLMQMLTEYTGVGSSAHIERGFANNVLDGWKESTNSGETESIAKIVKYGLDSLKHGSIKSVRQEVGHNMVGIEQYSMHRDVLPKKFHVWVAPAE